MALTREERKLLHQKSKQPTFGSGKPDINEGNEGDISFRKIEGSGTVEYVKQSGDWIAVAASGEMPSVRIIGSNTGSSSSGITTHGNLNGLSSDDHEHYALINGARPFTGDLTVGENDTGYDVKFYGATSGSYSLWDQSEDRYTLASAAGASTIRLLKNDSSINTNDSLGQIEFAGLDNAETVGCVIKGESRGTWDGSDTDSPSALLLLVSNDDSSTPREQVRIQYNSNTFNEQGYADVDFRVESVGNTHMFFIDSGINTVGINTDSPDSGSVFHVYGATKINNGAVDIDATTLAMDSTDTTNLTMTANAASTKTMTIAASNSNGSNISNIVIDADGDISLSADGDDITMDDGTTTRFTFNVDVGNLEITSGSSGDPDITFDINGTDKFTLGVDDSDSDKFKIDSGSSLTDASDFELDSSGNMEIAGTADIKGTYAHIHSPYSLSGDDAYAIKWDVDETKGQHITGGEADYSNNYSIVGFHILQATSCCKYKDPYN